MLPVAACAILGCLLASAFEARLAFIIGAVVILAISTAFSKRLRAILLPALFILVLFACLYCIRNQRPENLPVGKHTLSGIVTSEPIKQEDKHRTIITLKSCRADGKMINGKVRLYVYSTYIELETGDEIIATDTNLFIPSGVTNPDGFDFNQYLWRSGVVLGGTANYESIALTQKHFSLTRELLRLRRTLSNICDKVFGDSSDVMKAVLLGDRSSLSDETYNDFSASGISHLIALSGLHVSAIALLIEFLLKKLRAPRLTRYILTSMLLCLYAIMTGLGNSTIRAVLMYLILCLTRQLGYHADTLNRLCIALVIQLGINPLLIGDNGFILSYASVAAILCFSELYVFERESAHKKLKAVALSAKSSFSVQIVTFPLLAGMFYSVPLLSVPVNVLCIPLAMLALYAGAVVLLVGCVYAPAAAVLSYPIRAIWYLIKLISSYVAKLPFSSVLTSYWPAWLGILFVNALIFGCAYITKSRNRALASFIMMGLLIAISLLPAKQIDHLRITFLSVGEADGAVFNAQGHSYALDTGKDNDIVADFLTSQRLSVSGIFITHADSDHYGGSAEILSRYPNARVYLPVSWVDMDVEEELEALLEGRSISYLSQGDRVWLSKDVYADVIWPPDDYEIPDDNSGSLVLNVVYGNYSVLMMGDLPDKLDDKISVDADIIKVAHHGSKYATTERLLSVVTPEMAVISVGNNAYGHPTEEVLTRLADVGATIYRTDEYGAITIDIYPDGSTQITTVLQAED